MPTICAWHKNAGTGCSVRHAEPPGRPCLSGATVEQLRESFVRSPRDVRLGKLVVATILGRTRSVLLHHDSSTLCTRA
jgi:hypothetical protein